MVFDFTEEQLALRVATRAFMEATSSEPEVRRLMETPTGYDEAAWLRMAGELGLQGLVIPEEYGGSGAGMVELAIVLDEMGRRLLCSPFLGTTLAALAILETGDKQAAADLLSGIADGSVIATLAVAEDVGQSPLQPSDFTAAPADDGWTLDGQKSYILDGSSADLLIVLAEASGAVGLFAVDPTDPGVTRTLLPTFDRTRRLAGVELNRTPARLLGQLAGLETVARVYDLVRVAVSAENVGAAEFVLNMTVAYAKERVQFGRAIGSFQAIKHMCADTLLDVESARSAAYYAAWAAADGSDELAEVAPLAKAFTSDTLFVAASTNIQVHGGVAFTWEHPAHLYYRRAKSSLELFGNGADHRERLAVQLGL
jgi:alkylation response protein AidB-like acyl-CoA dehydrogenase